MALQALVSILPKGILQLSYCLPWVSHDGAANLFIGACNGSTEIHVYYSTCEKIINPTFRCDYVVKEKKNLSTEWCGTNKAKFRTSGALTEIKMPMSNILT